jgi:hypothetical protein
MNYNKWRRYSRALGANAHPIILKFFYDLIFFIDKMSELVVISRDFCLIRSKSCEFAQIRVNSGFFSGFPDLPEFIF